MSTRTQNIRGTGRFYSIYKSKEALSSSPETWGVDKQLWLLFTQVSLQRKNDIRLVNRLK